MLQNPLPYLETLVSAGPARFILKWHLHWHKVIAKMHAISDTDWTY
jgi:hypothetical protein